MHMSSKTILKGLERGMTNLSLFLLMVVETRELYYMRPYYMVIRRF